MDLRSGQYEEEMAQADAQFGPLYEKFAAPGPRRSSRRTRRRWPSGRSCSSTTARSATRRTPRGSTGFPNLTDNDWLYGGDPETIKATITNGRNGIMPPLGAALGERGRRRTWRTTCCRSPGMAHDAHARGARQGAVRADLRRLPRRGGQGQPAARRAQPHRQDLAATARARRRSSRPSRKGRNNQHAGAQGASSARPRCTCSRPTSYCARRHAAK